MAFSEEEEKKYKSFKEYIVPLLAEKETLKSSCIHQNIHLSICQSKNIKLKITRVMYDIRNNLFLKFNFLDVLSSAICEVEGIEIYCQNGMLCETPN